jgi:predicted transcriptional regulator
MLTESGLKPFYEIPKGSRAGGDIHLNWTDLFLHAFWRMGWYCIADNGRLSEGHSDIYAFPPKLADNGSKYDPDEWEIPPAWAVEFEVYPERHPDRVIENYLRNAASRIRTVFVTDSEERKKRILQALKENNVSAYVPVLLVNRAAIHVDVEKAVRALTTIQEPASLEQALAEAESTAAKEQAKKNDGGDLAEITEKQNLTGESQQRTTSSAVQVAPPVNIRTESEGEDIEEQDSGNAGTASISGENKEKTPGEGEEEEDTTATVMEMLSQELADDESLVRVLRTVKENPGLKSSDIVARLGIPRMSFMRKSAKLKELGLISTKERMPGYAITERGMALLEKIDETDDGK